jgi:hypothetical protein
MDRLIRSATTSLPRQAQPPRAVLFDRHHDPRKYVRPLNGTASQPLRRKES